MTTQIRLSNPNYVWFLVIGLLISLIALGLIVIDAQNMKTTIGNLQTQLETTRAELSDANARLENRDEEFKLQCAACEELQLQQQALETEKQSREDFSDRYIEMIRKRRAERQKTLPSLAADPEKPKYALPDLGTPSFDSAKD